MGSPVVLVLKTASSLAVMHIIQKLSSIPTLR